MYVKPTKPTAILLHAANRKLADTMRPLNFLKRLKLKCGRLGPRELTRLEALSQDRLRLEEIVEYLEERLARQRQAAAPPAAPIGVAVEPGPGPADPAAGVPAAATAAHAWVLWYRPSVKQKGVRRQWEPVAECATARDCTDAMEASGLPHGQWITLPKGRRP